MERQGIKSLKLGLPHTQRELVQFESLDFRIIRARGYDYADQEKYDRDCGRAVTSWESAIENIEMNLVPEVPEAPQARPNRAAGSQYRGVNIAQAGTVVMGDRNIVAKIDSIT